MNIDKINVLQEVLHELDELDVKGLQYCEIVMLNQCKEIVEYYIKKEARNLQEDES